MVELFVRIAVGVLVGLLVGGAVGAGFALGYIPETPAWAIGAGAGALGAVLGSWAITSLRNNGPPRPPEPPDSPRQPSI
jgi:hypothetical protein